MIGKIKQVRFCFVISTLSIDQYCKRKFLQRKYFETIKLSDSLLVILKEYPVSEILAVSILNGQIIKLAGYKTCDVPADFSAACLELASWNFNRYKGRRVGMSGYIRGTGVQSEHFEMSIPENVKMLLEPYKRKTI